MKERLNPFFYASNSQLLAYEKAWVDYVRSGNPPLENVISAEVFESWERCRENGLDPLDRTEQEPLNGRELERRRKAGREVLKVAEKYMQTIYDVINDTDISVDFIDPDGYMLKSMRSHSLDTLAELTHIGSGYNMSEDKAGTNAVALAIKNKKATQTSGAQFYMQKYHAWTVSAAPVLDIEGNVLGVISIGGNYETVHKHTLGMVIAATNAVENEIRIRRINDLLKANIQQRTELMSIVTDGVVYAVNGIVMQVNQEMCRTLGYAEEELIGKKLTEVLNTTPDVSVLFEGEENGYANREMVLKGRNGAVKCLYRTRKMTEGDNISQLLLFTKIEELKILANKITNVAEKTFDDIISVSTIMREQISMAKKAAQYGSRVLIEGESGTGKEIMAQAIHNESGRSHNAFIAIDCGTIPKELFESEMFGYVEGAFTGANKNGKVGLFELADKGTVFLDEIGNMPLEMQAKLLRVIQEGTITKVGGTDKIEIDVRVIAATNTDLKTAVENGKFREDLYYRLNVINIKIPPLRDRREDIPPLINSFIERSEKNSLSRKKVSVTPEAMHILTEYSWPGNIRQLQNVVERLLIFTNTNMISGKDIPYELREADAHLTEPGRGRRLEDVIVSHIKRVLAEENGNISKAAEILGVTRATVYKKLKE